MKIHNHNYFKKIISLLFFVAVLSNLSAQDFKGIYIKNKLEGEPTTIITINKGNILYVNGNIMQDGNCSIHNNGDIFVTDSLINNSTDDFFLIGGYDTNFHFIGNDTCVFKGDTIKFVNLENENTKVLKTESDIKVFGYFNVQNNINLQGNIELVKLTFNDEMRRGKILNETNVHRIYSNLEDSGSIYSYLVPVDSVEYLGIGLSISSTVEYDCDVKRKHKAKENITDGSIRKSFTIKHIGAESRDSITMSYFHNDFLGTESNEEDFKLWSSSNYHDFTKFQDSEVDPFYNFVYTRSAKLYLSDNDSAQITISDEICISPPQINFTQDTLLFCEGSSVEIDASNSGENNGKYFVWYLNNQIHLEGNDSIINTNIEGDYRVIVTNSKGCFNIDSIYIKEIKNPITSFTNIDFSCSYDSIEFINTSTATNENDIFSFNWDFGNNTFSSEENPRVKYDIAETYTVTLTVSNQHECASSFNNDISILQVPEASFSTESECLSKNVIFTNTTTTNIQITNYTIDFGDNQNFESNHFSSPIVHNYSETGTYDVNLIVQAFNSCIDTFKTSINVFDYVQADFAFNDACQNSPINFTNTSVSEIPLDFYLWNFGDSQISNEENPTNIYNQYGNYTIQLIAGFQAGCKDTTEYEISIFPSPNVSFIHENACQNSNILFFNNSSIPLGTINTHIWNFGNGEISNNLSPEMQFTSSGVYNISLICISDLSCSDTLNSEITIYPKPQANYSVQDVCLENLSSFINNSIISEGNLSYKWILDEYNSNNNIDTEFTFETYGNHPVSLISYSENNCIDTITKIAIVNQTPVLSLGGIVSTCTNSIQVDAENPGANYLWSDGFTGQINTFNTQGDYSVTIINQNSCEYTEYFSVLLNNEVLANLGNDTTVCGVLQLDAHNQGSIYEWSTGETGRYVTITTSGLYSVIITDPNNCIGYDTINVIVNPLPMFSLGDDINTCENTPVVLTANTPNGESILWSTGETSQTITVSESDNYWLKLTSAQGCSSQDAIHIQSHEQPIYPFGNDTSSCYPITLDAQNLGFEYLWSNNSIERTNEISSSGTYSVQIYNLGCSITDEIDITIDLIPIINLGYDLELCIGSEINLDAENPGLEYLWSTGDINQIITVNSSGNYSVTVTNQLGCKSSDNINITNIPSPIFDFGDHQTICNDETLIIDPNINAKSYSWYDENGLLSQSKTLHVDEPGRFWLDAVNSNGCVHSDTVIVTKNPNAVIADFLTSSEISIGDTLQIIDVSVPGTGDYLWLFGDGTSSSDYNPQHIYYIEGTYSILLNIENGGCSSSLNKSIIVNNLSKDIIPEKFIIDAEKEDKIKNAKIYPNPNRGSFICEVNLSEEYDVYLQIFNINGILIYNNKYSKQASVHKQIRLENLPAGLYIIKINVEDENKVIKFIKY